VTVEFTMIRVLVVDDHPFMRDALDDLFASTGDIEVVDGCADGSEVVPKFRRSRPDVVLMDLDMPQVGGMQASRALLQAFPDASVVLHTGRIAAAQIRQARSLGIKDCVLKGDDPSRLTQAVRKAADAGQVRPRSAAGPSAVA
jgi:DNA-binding NarL/FixJ family response regulator